VVQTKQKSVGLCICTPENEIHVHCRSHNAAGMLIKQNITLHKFKQ
jgi:hypothetical protein